MPHQNVVLFFFEVAVGAVWLGNFADVLPNSNLGLSYTLIFLKVFIWGIFCSWSGLIRIQYFLHNIRGQNFRESVFLTVFIWQLPCFGVSVPRQPISICFSIPPVGSSLTHQRRWPGLLSPASGHTVYCTAPVIPVTLHASRRGSHPFPGLQTPGCRFWFS